MTRTDPSDPTNSVSPMPTSKLNVDEIARSESFSPRSAPNAPYPNYQHAVPQYNLVSPGAAYQMYGYGQPSPNAIASPNLSMMNCTGGGGPPSFPTPPQMMDASQMLGSPSRFRKRRHLSPLIAGSYMDSHQSPTMHCHQLLHAGPQFLRRAPMPKIPVAPRSMSAGSSPKARSANLILPCFFDQSNQLRTHGPNVMGGTGPSAYWDDFRRNVAMFLADAEAVNEGEITIVEIKQLLRKYSINATGKKHVLMDRIKTITAHLKAQKEFEQATRAKQEALNVSDTLCTVAMEHNLQNQDKENSVPANSS